MPKTQKYSSLSPTKLPLVIIHKANAGCALSIGLFFLVVFLIVGFTCLNMLREFLHSQDQVVRLISYVIPGIFVATGIFVLIITIRQEYEEQIEITDLFVNYKRKGRLRKTISWHESLSNYTGIMKSNEDAVEDSTILTIVLKHKSNQRLNVVLDRQAETEAELEAKQNYYSALIKKPCIN